MTALLHQIHMELRELALKGDETCFNQLLRIAGDVVEELGEDPWLYQIPWLLEPCKFPTFGSGWVRVNWPPEYFDRELLVGHNFEVNEFPIGPFPMGVLLCLCNASSTKMFGHNLVWRSDWKIPQSSPGGPHWDFLQGFKRSSSS